MYFDSILSNPPYNSDNSISPIYHKFIEKFERSSKKQTWIVPGSFLYASNWGLSKKLRLNLYKMGLSRIKVNPLDTFTALVSTVTLYADGDKHDTIKYYSDTESLDVESLRFLTFGIYNSFDEKLWAIVDKLKKRRCFVGERFINGVSNVKIGTYDINRDMAFNKFGSVGLKNPDWNHNNAYRFLKLWEGDDLEEGERLVPIIRSFWYTDIMQIVLMLTKGSYGWSASHFSSCPWAPYDREWDNESLMDYFEMAEDEKDTIRKYHGKINLEKIKKRSISLDICSHL